jgi:hypothetical protein
MKTPPHTNTGPKGREWRGGRWSAKDLGVRHTTTSDRSRLHQIFDTCNYCGITGSFKRCPCSKDVRYCGSNCQDMHWGDHKAAHNAELASKRARRAQRA